MSRIDDRHADADRWMPQLPTIPAEPSRFDQVFEILWQLAVEEYPGWSHDRKRAWATAMAKRLFAEETATRETRCS